MKQKVYKKKFPVGREYTLGRNTENFMCIIKTFISFFKILI